MKWKECAHALSQYLRGGTKENQEIPQNSWPPGRDLNTLLSEHKGFVTT
jgi:hypothetical protein